MNSDIRMVEIATGHVSNRSQVAEIANIPDYIFDKSEKTETYHSWYQFDEQLDQHIKSTGTIQGYNGVYYVGNIVLDYDRNNLSDQQLYDAVHYLVNTGMIEDLGINSNHILIWYSGTGFHIEIPNLFGFAPSTTLPSIVRETLTAVFPECDSIYDGARLIRAGFSFNSKKGNFKIPYRVETFNDLSMKEILKDSVDRVGRANPYKWDNVKPYLSEYIKYPKLSIARENNTVRTEFRIDPNSVVTCMQTVLGNPPTRGERNTTMMRVGSWMRRSGIPKRIVEMTLSEWSGLPSEAKETSNKVFEQGYEYSCSDHIMAKHCKPNCIYFKHKDYNLNIANPEDLSDKFADFIQTDFTDKAFNFKDIYEIPYDHWVFPGELVIVTGNTGLGKSTWVQNLITKLPNMSTLFLSLENTYHLTFRRFCQITHALTKEQVIKDYKNSTVKPNYHEAFKHVHVLCEAPELGKLTETIARMQPKIVVVDTTDMVFVKGIHDEIGKMNAIINGLKAIAQSQEIIVIAVHHVNKQAMHEGVSTITSLKGTTNVVQKADKVFAINGDNNEVMRSVHSEKARDEGFMRMMFKFHKNTMIFEQQANSQGFGDD